MTKWTHAGRAPVMQPWAFGLAALCKQTGEQTNRLSAATDGNNNRPRVRRLLFYASFFLTYILHFTFFIKNTRGGQILIKRSSFILFACSLAASVMMRYIPNWRSDKNKSGPGAEGKSGITKQAASSSRLGSAHSLPLERNRIDHS